MLSYWIVSYWYYNGGQCYIRLQCPIAQFRVCDKAYRQGDKRLANEVNEWYSWLIWVHLHHLSLSSTRKFIAQKTLPFFNNLHILNISFFVTNFRVTWNMYHNALKKFWETSKRPPTTQFVCGVLSSKRWEGDDDVGDRIAGPLQRTAIKAPDIESVVPMILICVVELLKSRFSILFGNQKALTKK